VLEIMCSSLLELGMAFATHFTLQHDAFMSEKVYSMKKRSLDFILSRLLDLEMFHNRIEPTCKEAESQVTCIF